MRYPCKKIGIQSLLSLGLFAGAVSIVHAQSSFDPLQVFEDLVPQENISTTTATSSPSPTTISTSSPNTASTTPTTTLPVPPSTTPTTTSTTTPIEEDVFPTTTPSLPTTTPEEELPDPEESNEAEEESATSTPPLSIKPLPPPSILSNVYARMGPLPEEITRLLLQIAAALAIAGFLLIEQRTLEKISYAIISLFRPRSRRHQKEITKA